MSDQQVDYLANLMEDAMALADIPVEDKVKKPIDDLLDEATQERMQLFLREVEKEVRKLSRDVEPYEVIVSMGFGLACTVVQSISDGTTIEDKARVKAETIRIFSSAFDHLVKTT